MLQAHYKVTNLAQAGISEYKILKQLRSISLDSFDTVLICHTSPYRVHTKNSIHKTELHKDCDLLYSDIESRRWSFNPLISSAYGYFMHHYDIEYYEDIYCLFRKELDCLTSNITTLHIDHFDTPAVIERNRLDLSQLWKLNKGNINHYSEQGNYLAYNRIKGKLDEI